ncbi:PH domain-containing protein [Dermacoccus abyssi]|uniref:PH domain-containing protein n=1 Tax=Dermacoccus abyssi TaxID=322596 RepID=A0A417Z9Y9_9MICO|nr:PH domain-containing protein [Dermacoccus abyssi]
MRSRTRHGAVRRTTVSSTALINALTGNASLMKEEKAREQYGPWLLENERLEGAFELVLDSFCLTNLRLIALDREGPVNPKVDARSIPLASIVDVTARTAGIGIDDSDLTITYITSPRLRAHTVEYSTMTFTFNKSFDIAGLYRHLMTIAQRNYASLNDA